jgi:catechol 2,3-dioxygenase-like lactoylglutathione lyase family enzyme
MLDHVSLRVADYHRSRAFYEAALAPLGYQLAMEGASGAGGRDDCRMAIADCRLMDCLARVARLLPPVS